MLPANTILQGRYQIVAQIGRGGMGAVYKAIDTRLRNTVALKQTLVEGDLARRAFEREAQLLAGMRHAALPKVIDHFTEENGQYLVMEFIPGEDLGTLLATRGEPFAVADVLSWGDRLLDALEYLHSHNPPIIHRDIKPQNMKLTDRGEIILLDFGLAKGAVSNQATRPATTSSIFGYTPHYAPLEQIQGTGTGPRSDLYALAATMHHLLTGTPPPDALTRAAARINDEPDPLPAANQLNPEVPATIAGMLMQALAQKPDQRPASASDMRRLLREAARGGGATIRLPADPIAETQPISAIAARTATGDLPTIGGQLAIGTTISQPGGAPTQALPPGTPTVPISPPAAPRRAWVLPAIGGGAVAIIVAIAVATGVIGGGGGPAPTSPPATAVPAVGAPTATTDVLSEARATVVAEQTATVAAQATQTQIILSAIESVDATRTAIAQATIDAAGSTERTALAETAAVLALTPTATIEPPTATPAPAASPTPRPTRDPNAPTDTPRPTRTPTPTRAPTTPSPSALPTDLPAPAGKAAVLAQGGGSEFRGAANIGSIDPSQGDGGSCIQGSVKAADGSLFDSFLVGIDKGGALRKVNYNYTTGFFGACGLDAGDWGVVVYKAGGRDTSPADQGSHQVRLRLTGTPGEVAYVNFRAVNFDAPTATPTQVAGPYDGFWSGTISGKTSGGSKDFVGRFRMEVRANAIYSISVDGADCFFDTYPNFPKGQPIEGNSFGAGGQVFNPSDNSKADITFSVFGTFGSTSAASGTMSATQGGGQCLVGSWSAKR